MVTVSFYFLAPDHWLMFRATCENCDYAETFSMHDVAFCPSTVTNPLYRIYDHTLTCGPAKMMSASDELEAWKVEFLLEQERLKNALARNEELEREIEALKQYNGLVKLGHETK